MGRRALWVLLLSPSRGGWFYETVSGPRACVRALVLAAGGLTTVARADDAAKALGDWNLKVMTDDGQTLASVLKISQDDGKLKGVFVGMDGTEVKADEIAVKGDDLNFKVTLDFQGTELIAKFALKQEGSNLKGTVEYDLGGQTGTLDVTGGRAAAGRQDRRRDLGPRNSDR